jgi:hypothetical protein
MKSQENYKADFYTPQEGIQSGCRSAPVGKKYLPRRTPQFLLRFLFTYKKEQKIRLTCQS